MPVERKIVIPFALLAELATHEHQLLAGMSEHEAVIGAQVREALPVVARHPPQDRALAVDDFVVRQRQDEIFRKCVMQAEQDVAVMILAVDRVLADVIQRVMHPAHIPFVAEAQPTEFNGGATPAAMRLTLPRPWWLAESGRELPYLSGAGNRWRRDFPGRQTCSGSSRRRAGYSPDTAWKRRHRRAARRCRNAPARTARSTPGN